MKHPQTDNLPRVLPVRPWIDGDLAAKVGQFNDRVGAVRAGFAAEPAEKAALRALVLEDDCDLDAIAVQRQALELAGIRRLVEARRLHRTRPALAGACADAGRQVAADAATAVTAHAEELRRKAQDFNLSRDLVEEVVKADPQQQALDQVAAGLKYEAAMFASQAAPDGDALRAIEVALCAWADVEPPQASEDEEAEFMARQGHPRVPLSGMMNESPAGLAPAPVPDLRTEAQRLVDSGLGSFTHLSLSDGKLAADVAALEADKHSAKAAEGIEAAPADDAGDDEDGYPVLEDLAEVPAEQDALALDVEDDGYVR